MGDSMQVQGTVDKIFSVCLTVWSSFLSVLLSGLMLLVVNCES